MDATWSNIRDQPISGSKAAAEAAKVLGVPKVSSSRFKTLQGILDASEFSAWAVVQKRQYHPTTHYPCVDLRNQLLSR